jgi:mannose-6-phosphate isomerase-like protein (cupin superfamily)
MADSVNIQYIHKPWGFEHVLFMDKHNLILRLYINDGESTSLHCHPNKSTRMIVIRGTVKLTVNSTTYTLTSSNSIFIEKNAIHSSEAVDGDAELIEIDSPPLLTDIVRIKDKYGRTGKEFFYEDIKCETL